MTQNEATVLGKALAAEGLFVEWRADFEAVAALEVYYRGQRGHVLVTANERETLWCVIGSTRSQSIGRGKVTAKNIAASVRRWCERQMSREFVASRRAA